MENNTLVSFGKHAYSELVEPGRYRIHFNRVAFILDKDELSSINGLFKKASMVERKSTVPADTVIAWNGIGEIQSSQKGFFVLRIYNCTLCLCERMLRCFRQLCACTERNTASDNGSGKCVSGGRISDIDIMLDSISKEVFGNEPDG